MPYNHKSFRSKLTKGQGRWAKKSEKSRKSGKVKPGQGGVRNAPYQEGSWVEKPRHVCCCYSHHVSGEQALERGVVIETKPSRDGLVEYFVKTLGLGDSRGHPEKHV